MGLKKQFGRIAGAVSKTVNKIPKPMRVASTIGLAVAPLLIPGGQGVGIATTGALVASKGGRIAGAVKGLFTGSSTSAKIARTGAAIGVAGAATAGGVALLGKGLKSGLGDTGSGINRGLERATGLPMPLVLVIAAVVAYLVLQPSSSGG